MKSKSARKRKDSGRGSGPLSARALLERIERKEGAEEDGSRLTARERAYVERAQAAQEMQERAFDRPTMTQAQMMLASLRGAGPLVVKRFREGGDVDLAEQMTVGTLPEDREPGKAEEAFRALVEGSQGFLGLEPGRRGSEAYRTGQALSNLPALALPAAAIKGTGKAKDALRALGKKETPVDLGRVFAEVDKLPTNQYIDEVRSAHIGGVGDFGEGDAKYFFSRVPGGERYIKQSQQIAKKNLGNQFMGYRLMSRDEFEALQAGDVGDLLSFSLDRNAAEAFRNFVKNQNRKDLVVAEVPLTPKHVVAFGSPGEKEVIVDTGQGWAMDAFRLADPVRKRQAGSPPEGEMSNDEYIQQMFTGTPPMDRQRSPGLLPPELRQAVDVPLDLANLFVRGTAAAVAGPAYGLYKGVTGGKYGTPEGVQEASSEAARMMAKITGEPKTQTARDVVEFIGEKTQALKLAPTPQLLTAPLPGPGAASALLRNYELAQTAPVGTINVPGAKAKATPPKNEMGFFSPTEQVVMNLPQEKGTAQQMLAQISKAPGAKAAELRATGLEEFLKSKGTAPVTRQEIQDYLASNRVEVDEVVLGRGQTLSPEAKRLMGEAEKRMMEADDKMAPFFEQMAASGASVAGQEPYSMFYRIRGPLARELVKGDQDAINELYALKLPPDVRQAALDFAAAKGEYRKYARQARRMDKPKFDKYNIPGGTNPREIYLTLPLKRTTEAEARSIVGDETWNRMTPEQRQEFMSYPTEAAKQNQFTVPYAHSVSPEADRNRLAHIFLDDRTDAEGNKVLFVQELQSDWAQQGRDRGFRGNLAEAQKAFADFQKELVAKYGIDGMAAGKSTPEENARSAQLAEAVAKADKGLAPAPFVTNTEDWVNLALKRVIKDAVDNGYDKVAFIKGEQAADKYDIRKQVNKIDVEAVKEVPNLYFVDIDVVGGKTLNLEVENGIVRNAEFAGKALEDVVGKEIAEKVMSVQQGKTQRLTGDDLRIGGQGMKGFYDNILPKTANKLLAKLGSKIEPVDFGRTKSKETWVQGREHPFEVSQDATEPFEGRVTLVNRETGESRAFNTRDEANEYMAEALGHNKDQIHLGFRITPEMIDMVKTQGLPQFAAGGEVTKFIKAHA